MLLHSYNWTTGTFTQWMGTTSPYAANYHDAILAQKKQGRRAMEDIYGDGTAGRKIAEILAELGRVEVQKRITY